MLQDSVCHRDRSKSDPVIVLEHNGVGNALAIDEGSVLASQIFEGRSFGRHDDPRVATRERGRLDAHSTITITADEARTLGKMPLATP